MSESCDVYNALNHYCADKLQTKIQQLNTHDLAT